MEVLLVGKWVALPGFTEILQVHQQAWTWMILTKANALCTVEGVGSHGDDTPDASILACALST